MSISSWNKNKWRFKDIHSLGFPYNHIHPHKQKAVKHLVDRLPSWVSHVIVFGSAVGTWHLRERDLDVCIIGENPVFADCSYRADLRMKGIGIDFLEKPSLADVLELGASINSVYRDVVSGGVMVYEKS